MQCQTMQISDPTDINGMSRFIQVEKKHPWKLSPSIYSSAGRKAFAAKRWDRKFHFHYKIETAVSEILHQKKIMLKLETEKITAVGKAF